MVKSATEIGSMFSIDVDGREYWLTAKHILTGKQHPPAGVVSIKNVDLDVLDPTVPQERWEKFDFAIIDPGNDIDIVVLVPSHSIQVFRVDSLTIGSEVMFGGECEFLGFPFANSWMTRVPGGERYKMPYIKHCYVSGLITEPYKLWILDGINNKGFSGGPVVVRTGPDQRIFAVISSYAAEQGEVQSVDVPVAPRDKPTGDHAKQGQPTKKKSVVELNSGIITAFDATYALDAIKKNPIGPLVKPK